MKRLLAFALVLVMALSLAACGGSGDGDTSGATGGDGTVISFGTKDFQIVRPEGSSLQPSAVKIITAVRKATDITLKSFDDLEPESEKYEILLGSTNRKESKMAREMIESSENFKGRKFDYIIAFINNKIVINGMSDEAIETAIDKFVSDYCNTAKIANNEKYIFNDASASYKDVLLNGIPIWKYKFVVPKYNVSYFVTSKVQELVDYANEVGAYGIEIVRDDTTPAEYEVIIDNCDREGVTAISTHENYDVKVTDKKIYINGGRNYATAYVLQTLVSDIKEDNAATVKNSSGTYYNDFDLQLVWYDEFDEIDSANIWNVFNQEEPWMGGWYGMTNYRSSNDDTIYAKDGKMYHVAHYDDKYFYGTFLTTKGKVEFTYGYTEISSKLADGPALWHCFWLWDSGLTPGGDLLEFDIMECPSGAQTYFNVIHESRNGKLLDTATAINDRHSFCTIDGAYKNDTPYYWTTARKQTTPDRLMSERFHNFGFYWDEEKVEFYRDGTLTLRHEYVGKETEDLYRNPHYIILSFANSANKAGYSDDIDPTDKKLVNVGKPDLEGDYWKNGKNIWTIDYVQLFQKEGWYLNTK